MMDGEAPRLFLGLDLSLTGTGLVVLDEAGVVRRQGLFGEKLPRGCPVRERLERMIDIARRILVVVREAAAASAGPVAWVAGVEHYAFSRHGAVADLGEINGVVKTQLWLAYSIEAQAVVASSARKLVLGRGNVDKRAILPLLEERGFAFEDHNIADAYVVAEALRRRVVHGEGTGVGGAGSRRAGGRGRGACRGKAAGPGAAGQVG